MAAGVPEKEKNVVNLLLETSEKNEEWFNAHLDELREKYENMFLAIKDQKVVAVSMKIEDLLNDLKVKNEDLDLVFITSILPKGIAFIL